MSTLAFTLVELGILLALSAYVFTFSYNILNTAMSQSTNMMEAINTGDTQKINDETEKMNKFIKESSFSSLSFLENLYSSFDSTSLQKEQKDRISEALEIVRKMKDELGVEKGNENLEKDLNELTEYLKSLTG